MSDEVDPLARQDPPGAGRVYRGHWSDDNAAVVTVNWEPLSQVVFHSPSGYAWGYGGSGPADLALSILGDYFGCTAALQAFARASFWTDEQVLDSHCQGRRAWDLHQAFKIHFIAPLDQDASWAISGADVAAWLEGQP